MLHLGIEASLGVKIFVEYSTPRKNECDLDDFRENRCMNLLRNR